MRWALAVATLMAVTGARNARAQVPADIEAGLKKIGQIVDPACTAKLYRPLMPANDVNSKATPLYKGIDIARDVSFGPNAKDVVDIFTRRQARRLASGVDLRARRRRQQDRAAGQGRQRVLRQHHALGHEKRDGRRQHAAPPGPGQLGRWRQGRVADDPVAAGEHLEIQGRSRADVHLGALRRKRSTRHLSRPPRAVRAERRGREGRHLHVRAVQYRAAAASGRGRARRWCAGSPSVRRVLPAAPAALQAAAAGPGRRSLAGQRARCGCGRAGAVQWIPRRSWRDRACQSSRRPT